MTLLEKAERLGGNSAKATSGINGWGSAAQAALGIEDSAELLAADTMRSGSGGTVREGLVQRLGAESRDALGWLEGLGVPLSVVAQLGGHSRRRTHRAPDKADGTPTPIGFTIMQTLERHVRGELSERVRVVTGAAAQSLIVSDGTVRGVRYAVGEGSAEAVGDAVVLCTGGFSGDRGAGSLLGEFAPGLLGVATTNGPFATGDGVKMARAIGAGLVDMDKVQLHPTAFVNPKEPGARTKFLGPEALRGSGGILLNPRGERFVDELGLRAEVTAAINAQGAVYPGSEGAFAYCVLGETAAELFGRGALNFYWQRMGLFRRAADVGELAAAIGCEEAALRSTLEAYELSSRSGERCAATGKSVYPSVLGTTGPYYVAAVTPAVHYTMGGVAMDEEGRVLSGDGSVIRGLYGAGEVTGGLHGANRLAGNSLLECAVFGRVAGRSASLLL